MTTIQTYLSEPRVLGTQSESVSFPYTTTYTGYFDFSILLNNVGSDVVNFTISVDGNEQPLTYTVDGNEQKTIFFDGRFDAGQVISISSDSVDGQVLEVILAGDDLLATENKDITNVTSASIPYTFETATEVNIQVDLSNTSQDDVVYDIILRQGDSDDDILLKNQSTITSGQSITETFNNVIVESNDILEINFTPNNSSVVIDNVSITSSTGLENEPYNFLMGVVDVETTNEVFEPKIIPGNVTIFPREITNLSFVPNRHVVSQAELKSLEILSSEENNVISNSPIASKFSFYNVPTTEVLQPNNLIVSESILPNLGRQRAEDAVFTSEVYSSFYVRNNSNDEYAQIFFGINGGENIRVETDGFTGNIHEVDVLNLNQVLFPPNLLNEYKDQAFVRTSLFNQATIEVSVAPKNTQLRPLEEENLQDINFVQGNERLQLPNLSPGDYVGVYLKVNTNFNVNLGLPVDYSFLHLSYSNLTRGEFLTVPGQVYNRSQNEYKPRLLPSLVIPFVTDYQRLLELINRTTEDLYALYPPFFEYYTNE